MNGKTFTQTPNIGYVQVKSPSLLEGFWEKTIATFLVVLLANGVMAGQLTLTWNDNSDNEDGFKVERAIDGVNFEQVGTVDANVATFLDTTVAENQAYYYRVNAFNEYGSSGYTNTANGLVSESNDAPVISGLSNVAILEGGNSGVIQITVGDNETNAADLALSASSSNQDLLADSGIVLGGSGSERTFDLTPVSGASGTSTVTITVSDGTQATSESFTLDVQSVTVPVISSIADVSTTLGSLIDPIAFSVEDVETAAGDLTIGVSSSNTALLPIENISIEGTGSNRTLTAVPGDGFLGATTATITVGDGSGEAIEAFEIAVTSAPIIRYQPVDTSEFIGGITALSVEVDAYPEPSYQWMFNGEPIEGANESELLFLELLRSHEGQYSVVVANGLGNISSEEVQLTVDSLIQVIQSPINVTLDGEGTAVLSVSAEGPGLSYQWYRGESGDKSNPIEGATSSSYETDRLSATTKYWVEILSGNLEQSIDIFNSDTTTVFFQPIPRFYFGTFGPGNQGSFGLMAREDKTAVLLANMGPLGRVLETSDMVITAQGRFVYEEGGAVVLSGTIDGDSVSGIVAGTDIVFEGTKSSALGVTADFAGFYYAVLPNTSDGQVLVIAGPDGTGFVSAGLGEDFVAGAATIGASGILESDIDERYALALQIDNSTASVDGTIMVAQASYSVDGQREDVQTKNILFNTSIRGQVKGGSGTMIAGFVVSGSGSKKVLIRGLGPSLVDRGIANAVMDPQITLYRFGESEPIAENDNWTDASNASDISDGAQLVGAAPLAISSKESALLVELTSGVYTAHVTNADVNEGIALVEVYDVSEAEGADTGSSLANISMRGEVASGDNAIIAGFVVTGDSPKRLLVRAMGPELQDFNVSGTLVDPRLTIFKSTNEGMVEIGGNDDWHEDPVAVTNAAAQSGAFPFAEGSSSAGQVIWLDPGLYTAVVNSGDGSSGVALVEVYEVK
ncbi:MAG: hypothetical protein HOI15_03900 [Opitutales bacterium]|nr:hypothetical protein [Opitutales bacterium]